MYSYSVTIGRNVGETPMSDSDWEAFISDVTEALAYHMIEGDDILEIHRGQGSWGGVVEDSAKVTLMSEESINVERLKIRLLRLAVANGQDAIALTIGQSELIEPVRSWDVCPICGNSGSAPGWLTVHTCYAP